MFYSCEKSISWEKYGSFHWEISAYPQEYDDVTIPYYSISSLLSVKCRLREVENKRKGQTFISRRGRGLIREVVAYKRFHIVIWQGSICTVFWKTRRLWEVFATGGLTVFEFQLTKPFTVRGSITSFCSLTDLALNSNKVLLLLSSFFKLRCITVCYISELEVFSENVAELFSKSDKLFAIRIYITFGKPLNRNSTLTRSSIFLMLMYRHQPLWCELLRRGVFKRVSRWKMN